MATRTAKLRVELDGEKEYKQAISELNRDNRVLASEMEKLSAAYKNNEHSVEALTAKVDVYQKQLDTQQAKTRETREMLTRAIKAMEDARVSVGATSDAYKDAQRKVYEYQITLNKSETAELKLKNAIDETNAEIAQQGDAAEDNSGKLATLGDQVSGIADKFGIHLPDSIKTALDHVDGFSSGTVAAMGVAAAGIAAVEVAVRAVTAGIDAAKKLYEITIEEGKWADDLLTRSAKTGLSTTLLQQLDYAQKFLDFDGIDKSLVKLTASMDAARDGAEKQSAAFETLGISVVGTDGQLRNSWDVFMETIDALGQVESAAERDALANDLFGRSYADLKPLIDAGSEGLQEFMDKAVETGVVLDEDQVQKLGEVDDAYQQYQEQIKATKEKLAVEFAPVAIEVMDKFGELATKAGDKLVESGILDKLEGFVEPLGVILGDLIDLGEKALPLVLPLIDDLAEGFQIVADVLGYVTYYLGRILELLPQVDWDKLNGMSNSADYGFGVNAAGTDNWRGGLTWVGESGPELVALPRGSQIYSNQESRGMGGDQYITINVQGIQQLDEVVRWYESRRVVGRMA